MTEKAPAKKSLWFPLYAKDFMSSPDVQIMEAHEVGAYLLLMMHSWQSDMPGFLPNDEGRLRRASRLSVEAWKESGALLLSKWPVAQDPTLRYNPRLLLEAENALDLRKKKSEAGQKSAELRAARKAEDERLATEGQQKVNRRSTGVEQNGNTPAQNLNQSQSQLQSTNVDEEREASSSSPVLKAEKGGQSIHPAAAHAESLQADTFTFAESFFTKPDVYAVVLRDLGFAEVDAAHYAREIRLHSEEKGDRLMMSAWRKRLASWLKNDKARGCLLLAAGNGIRPASPDPEADRLRAAQPVAVAQPTAGYTPYVSRPNLPGTVAEPATTYGPASTIKPF